MNAKLPVILFLLILFAVKSYSQPTDNEYFITANGNLYIPINNPAKGVYPILWYDKQTDPNVLIGGLGIGFTAINPYRSKLHLKGQVNLSRHVYWDEPIPLIDNNGNPSGVFLAGSSDFSVGITATAHYLLTDKISVGTGVGGQVLLVSLSRTPEINSEDVLAANNYYKRVIPVLPLELSYKTNAHLFNIRYEHGLLNKYKKGLATYKTDNYGLLYFEVGFKLNR